ncbi:MULTISPECIES: hypothetical protein [Pseudoalteromonas]|uniref:hypothetical protein n=1 Tax=Pseudoalteromonas TaxID=53246 RepID=UPI00147F15E1|nr:MULTISPECIES: hypothetical protein [Pseudoalteromonas]
MKLQSTINIKCLQIRSVVFKDIQVLDISDEYRYMNDELLDMLKHSVGSCLPLQN